MRSGAEVKKLWVDQICINQHDLDEKSAQVSIMGAIYRLAAQVIIWLGPASPTSNCALSFAEELLCALSAFSDKYGHREFPLDSDNFKLEPYGFELPPRSDQRWTALGELLDQPWFSRYWVIQEAMVNRTVVFQCGDHQLDWSIFLQLSFFLTKYKGLHSYLAIGSRLPAGVNLLVAINIARNRYLLDPHPATGSAVLQPTNKIKNGFELGLLIQLFCSQSVSLDCDRIYALLETVDEPVAHHIVPNYKLSTEQIYMDFALESMEHYGNLNTLNLVEYSENMGLKGLPSWVPDWTTKPKAKAYSLKAMEYTHFQASGSRPAYKHYAYPGKKLYVRGQLVDTVLSQGIKPPVLTPFSVLEIDDQSPDEKAHFAIAWFKQWDDFYGMNESAINECQPYPTGESTAKIMCRLLSRDCASSPHYQGPTIEDIQNALPELREVSRYCGQLHKNYQKMGDGWRLKLWNLMYRPPSIKRFVSGNATTNSVLHIFGHELYGNLIVRTKSGYIANIPAQTKPGDKLAIINGYKTHLVLRPHDSAGYALIGDCYVHGIMYGESLSMDVDEKEIGLL